MYDLDNLVLLHSYGALIARSRCRYKHSAPPELNAFGCGPSRARWFMQSADRSYALSFAFTASLTARPSAFCPASFV
jgi:hypothetical protein